MLQEPGLVLNTGKNTTYLAKGEKQTSNISGTKFKNFFSKRRKSDPGYPLRRVALQTDNEDKEDDWSEYNLFADEETYGNEEHIPDDEKFNNLRQERLNKRKEDLINLLDLIKDDKEKAAKFLDEIIK